MIPAFSADGLLPPGIFVTDQAEMRTRFAGNIVRVQLLAGITFAALNLTSAGCKRLWIDGSFVTAEPYPQDWDGCWDPLGVDLAALDPALLDFSAIGRSRMKQKYLADLFPSSSIEKSSTSPFIEYFQIDRKTGRAKGILQINLAELP